MSRIEMSIDEFKESRTGECYDILVNWDVIQTGPQCPRAIYCLKEIYFSQIS